MHRLAVRTVRVFASLALDLALIALAFPWMVATSRTWRGRLFGLTCLSSSAGCAVWVAGLIDSTAIDHALYEYGLLAAVVVWLASAVALILLARRVRPRGEYFSPWSSSPYEPTRRPRTLPEAVNFLELDFLRLALFLLIPVGPLLVGREARQLRRVARRYLAEMEADPAYRPLYPGYADLTRVLVTGHYWWQHCYAYTPRPADGEKLAVLIFLHGHGPNTALYLHLWRKFADEFRCAIACPTFGYGNWEHPDGVEAVRWVLDEGTGAWCLDPSRIYLAGLSQGGAGVGRAGAALAERLAGLVFISPTTEPEVLGSAGFAAGWRGRPVLVIQGERDRSVKPADVAAAAELMRSNGAAVTYHADPEAGHGLFFTKFDEVRSLVGAWIAGARSPPARG